MNAGGVTSMEPFLEKFFPSVLKKMADNHTTQQDVYCTFNSQVLTAFTSSLYIAGLVASLAAGLVMNSTGRKGTLVISGILFLVGSALDASAINVEMLIFGRLFLGIGIGFANQVLHCFVFSLVNYSESSPTAAPIYLSEMAPPKWRGTLATAFQFFLTFGNVTATLVNFFAAGLNESGWRVSLGFGAVPAALMTVGALFIPDTPGSLVQRGKIHKARESLSQVRGIDSDNEAELNDIMSSNEAAKASHKGPYRLILHQRYRPHLVLTVAVGLFQQLTGINLVAFYAPVLFRTFGWSGTSALLGAILLGMVNCGSTLVSTYLVDRAGRRFLYLEGGVQTCISQVAIAYIIASEVGDSGTAALSNTGAVAILVLMCSISAAFGWSWGPLTWIIPSEILPLEVRPAGQAICIASNFALTFVLAQISLAMFCHLKYGVFLLFAAVVIIMTVFLALFLPETKGIRPGSMGEVWKNHWYWRRFVEQMSIGDDHLST
ncbi:hypothetical protein RHGRI_032336 [Rhododendron griersonianum]|uniref:Major facilitator superfamily (MFS) profile domain-containing protein n=1 Tax=Rhododendron griersonianum TaxID=479676 RepID=A0AAV6IC58_9ERIC|nr:hypothetical protein RHGRI_032336 [Rhododendron griersonianum]